MYIQDFLVKLEKKESLPPVIVFSGEAEDVKAEGLARLKQTFRTRHPSGRLRFIDGGAEDLIAALDEARTPSLFHEPKLIVVLNAQKSLNAETAPALASYLESPVEDHYLVLLRKDSKSAAVLKKAGWSVDCAPLAAWKEGDWLLDRCKERGLTIGKETALELLDKTGGDVACIRQALDMLETVVRPRTRIESRDLQTAPLPGSEPGVYALMDAVGKRNVPEALRLLRESEGDERGAASLLCQRIRELLAVALRKARGMSQPLACEDLGLSHFRLKNLWEQASRFNAGELRRMMKELIELQAATVTGRLGKSGQTGALEAWLLKRTANTSRRPPVKAE